jgi:hypothetical protein
MLSMSVTGPDGNTAIQDYSHSEKTYDSGVIKGESARQESSKVQCSKFNVPSL